MGRFNCEWLEPQKRDDDLSNDHMKLFLSYFTFVETTKQSENGDLLTFSPCEFVVAFWHTSVFVIQRTFWWSNFMDCCGTWTVVHWVAILVWFGEAGKPEVNLQADGWAQPLIPGPPWSAMVRHNWPMILYVTWIQLLAVSKKNDFGDHEDLWNFTWLLLECCTIHKLQLELSINFKK